MLPDVHRNPGRADDRRHARVARPARQVVHIGAWNSVIDEHNYLVRKWGDFLKAGR
ncbi:hypothetical protein CLJ1_2573 [Pseudomonas paraeruginosa]|nr:hypothetical protein CLJ1_2573 [Pseudomonas aeruginosa]